MSGGTMVIAFAYIKLWGMMWNLTKAQSPYKVKHAKNWSATYLDLPVLRIDLQCDELWSLQMAYGVHFIPHHCHAWIRLRKHVQTILSPQIFTQ